MATSAVHFHDHLTQKLADVVRQRFRDLPFENGTLIPVSTDLQAGVREVSEDVLTGVGEASLLAPGASDIPLVQISMTEDRYPVVMAVAAYSLEFQERRALEFSNKPVSENRLNFARRAIAERLNRFAAYGEAGVARGLYNNANASIDNNSFNPNTADFATFVAFMVDLVLRLGIESDGVAYTTDVLMSPRFYGKAQQVTNPTNSDISVLQAVRNRLRDENNISSVVFSMTPESAASRLEKHGVLPAGTNKDRLVVYTKEPMCVQRQVEQQIAALMPPEYVQVKGTTQFYPLFSCASATKVREIGSIRYIDVNKAN